MQLAWSRRRVVIDQRRCHVAKATFKRPCVYDAARTVERKDTPVANTAGRNRTSHCRNDARFGDEWRMESSCVGLFDQSETNNGWTEEACDPCVACFCRNGWTMHTQWGVVCRSIIGWLRQKKKHRKQAPGETMLAPSVNPACRRSWSPSSTNPLDHLLLLCIGKQPTAHRLHRDHPSPEQHLDRGMEQTHGHTYPLHLQLTRRPDAYIQGGLNTRSVGHPRTRTRRRRVPVWHIPPDLKLSDEDVAWIQQFHSHDTAEHQGDEVTEPDEEGDLVLVPFVWHSRAVSFCPFQPCISPEHSHE